MTKQTAKSDLTKDRILTGVKDRISIVIPAYNEEMRLPSTIRSIKSFFIKLKLDIEVIIVVEKSRDKSLEVAKQYIDDKSIKTHAHFQLIDNKIHRGKGYAVKSGMKYATGEYIFFCDADLAVPLTEVLKFVTEFQKNPNVDILIANRRHNQSSTKQTFLRQKFGQFFNFLTQKLTGLQIQDTQCGFKAFRHKAAKMIFPLLKCDHFAFDVEILLLAKYFGYNHHSLPVVCWNHSKGSTVNPWIDPLKMLKDVIMMKHRISRLPDLQKK